MFLLQSFLLEVDGSDCHLTRALAIVVFRVQEVVICPVSSTTVCSGQIGGWPPSKSDK